MAKKFNTREIIITEPKHSSIDMSCTLRGTGKLGRMIPTHVQNLMPNTTINYTPNTLVRFAPLAAPLMSNISMRHHVFTIPLRQLYKNWETFITGGEFNTDNSQLPSFSLYHLIIYGSITCVRKRRAYITTPNPKAIRTI